MAEDICFNIIKDIERIASEIQFKSDSRLKELFQMTVNGDQNRLENAKTRFHEATASNDYWAEKKVASEKKLGQAIKELERAKLTSEQLRNGVITTSSCLQSVQSLKTEISHDRQQLEFYKEATGVRFAFNSPQDAVYGYVATKGETPQESKIQPFTLPKSNRVTDNIWSKIAEIVEDVPPSSATY